MGYLGKITANVQKRLKPASFGADFLYDRKYRPYREKGQNSNVEWDRPHGEIEAVKLENMIFCNFPQFLEKGFQQNSMN